MAKYTKRTGSPGNYKYEYGTPGASDAGSPAEPYRKYGQKFADPDHTIPWAGGSKVYQQKAAHALREMQNIKKRLKERHGGRIFDSYSGLGAAEATSLRESLETFRVAYDAWSQGKEPTKESIADAIARLNKSGEGVLENLEDFAKAKYTKRTGSPGNYKYEYETPGGGSGGSATPSTKQMDHAATGSTVTFMAGGSKVTITKQSNGEDGKGPGWFESGERMDHAADAVAAGKHKVVSANLKQSGAQRAANAAGEFFSAPAKKPAAAPAASKTVTKFGVELTPVGGDRMAFAHADIAKLVAAGIKDLSSVKPAGDKLSIATSALKKGSGMSVYDALEDLTKANYIKRTGTPGNYKYEYADKPTRGGDTGSGKWGSYTPIGKTDSGKTITQGVVGDHKDWSADDHDDARYHHKQEQTKHPMGSRERKHHEHVAEYHDAKNYEKEMGKPAPGYKDNPYLNPKKKGEAKKSMDDIDLLKSYAGLPSGSAKMGHGKSAAVEGGSADGGELAGVGTTSGEQSGKAGPGQDKSTGQVQCGHGKNQKKFSEDDAEDEGQMKPHTKPIEKIKKSYDGTPQSQRDQVAHEHAVATSQLRKGAEYVTHGPGIATPAQAPVQPQAARSWRQDAGSMVSYSNASDLACEQLQKSQETSMYHGEHLGFGAPRAMLRDSQLCKSQCGTSFSKALTACPSCGAGANASPSNHGTVLQKAATDGPYLRPRREDVLYLPNGVK